MKTHVVKYPGSIKKVFGSVESFKKHKFYGIVSKAGLPEGSGVTFLGDAKKLIFTILLPTGEGFSGAAIHKEGDEYQIDDAVCIAAGRAVAVWKAQKTKDEGTHPVFELISAKLNRDIIISVSEDVAYGNKVTTTIKSVRPIRLSVGK